VIRRDFLLGSASCAATVAFPGCTSAPSQRGTGPSGSSSPPSDSSVAPAASSPSSSPATPRTPGKVLLVFFSRAGENYFHGGRKVLTVGNTAVVAGMIRESLGCDAFQIRPVDPYPHAYDATVRRNTEEQERKARPAIVDPPASIDAHDTILMGSPIWNVRAPRIMLTFAERYDFTGKTVFPFTTHAMSGLGHVVEEYAAACRGARLGEALAIRGEEAAERRADVEAWLRRAGLAAG
jgi:flavodoxin